MKSLIRRLYRSNSEDSSEAAKGKKPRDSSVGQNAKGRASFSEGSGDSKHLSGLPGWLNSVARHALPFQLSTSTHNTNEGDGDPANSESHHSPETLICAAMDPVKVEKPALNIGVGKDQQPVSILSFEEDCQLQIAMVLRVQDNPNAVHIEAAKQISLGAFSSSGNTPAEVLAFRYWNCNVLDYDDNIVDGFYDVYGVVSGSNPEMMPSLMDLQGTPLSEGIAWEAVLVDRATDSCLKELVLNAVTLAVESKAVAVGPLKSGLVEKIAGLVSDQMGGPVIDPNEILKRWRNCSDNLRASHENIVLPLGSLQVGLARHRALLFKVLADTIGIPCKLVKGRQVTGSDEWAINIIKLDDAREFIVDLMGAPGTLIPSNGSSFGVQAAVGNLKTDELQQSLVPSELGISNNCMENDGNAEMFPTDITKMPKCPITKMPECPIRLSQDEFFAAVLSHAGKAGNQRAKTAEGNLHPVNDVERQVNKPTAHQIVEFPLARPSHSRLTTSFVHKRSPSWTEGMGSPFLQDMKVKDVSHYMMNAAKENPCLAQKLHDVLLESGVVAPRNLFTADVSRKQLQSQASEDKKILANAEKAKIEGALVQRKDGSNSDMDFLSVQRPEPEERSQKLSSVEGMCERRPLSTGSTGSKDFLDGHMAQPVVAVSETASVLSVVDEKLPPEVIRRVPVATAAAAATAAVVASSMMVAASKADLLSEPKFEVPIAAAATATAAVVVATSALVARKFERNEMSSYSIYEEGIEKDVQNGNFEDADRAGKAHQGTGQDSTRSGDGILEVGSDNGDRLQDFQDRDKHNGSFSTEEEHHSDKSNESLSVKSDFVMDDVAEWEIPWEEIVIGERIGIGSYGEVYRGDWHGTEVAVKKFLNQDISGDALEEFRSEVRIMRRLRHPNVVLFMGAVTRVPNLSIVIEFIPRGSLYRLMHRPNNKLDERRRLRVALDVARGMNYLHSSTPMIVHRDLKSPNLLVDKNWVVKVCDFGLSRLKNSTFLSSKSTSGTPEWMAPELLRNEPSNEKCDIYSFGVILWELATLQKPWGWMSPMQVVGAVGFQHRRLDIPDYVDPATANIVQQCWQSDPSLRPSFAEILALLKPLQKLILPGPRSAQYTTKPRIITNL